MSDWASASWLAAATTWLDEQLAAAGIRRTGEVTQPHLKAWATALRAPTDAGTVWLKAAGPGTAFEIRLYPVLFAAAPAGVLEPIAVDEERAWIVLPDGGPSLFKQTGGDWDKLVERLVTAVADYATLQREVQSSVLEMRERGVPDMRPEVMPDRFDEAVASVAEYAGTKADDDQRAAFERVRAMRDEVKRWSERLAGSRVGVSIDHHDLHPGNILGEPGEPARFYDWGDAAIAHPFFSMFVPLNLVADEAGEAAARRLRDSYLDVFADVAPEAELREELDLACRLTKVARTLTWQRALQLADDDHKFASAPLNTLLSVEKPSYAS